MVKPKKSKANMISPNVNDVNVFLILSAHFSNLKNLPLIYLIKNMPFKKLGIFLICYLNYSQLAILIDLKQSEIVSFITEKLDFA